MRVSEIFYSIQGEGKTMGQPAVFLRLAGCNLRCSFCDSSYTWLEFQEMQVEEVLTQIKPHKHLVITGGEPLLQQTELEKLLMQYNGFVEIETNGTLMPIDYLAMRIDLWNISPKEKYFMITEKVDTYPIILEYKDLLKDYIVKFVYVDKESLGFVKSIQKEFKIPNSKIYLMPEGIEYRPEFYKEVVEICKTHNYNFSARLHIILYGNERGK